MDNSLSLKLEERTKLAELWQMLLKLQKAFDGHRPSTKPAAEAQNGDTIDSNLNNGVNGAEKATALDNPDTALAKCLTFPNPTDESEFKKIVPQIVALLNKNRLTLLIADASRQESPDSYVLRFLRARKWQVAAAIRMLLLGLHWRYCEANIHSDVLKNGEERAVKDSVNGGELSQDLSRDFMAQIRMGKSFLHAVDRDNRPIWQVRPRLHKSSDQSNESVERYCLYLIETARLTFSPPVETITMLYDMTGFGLANMDFQFVKFITKVFEANYPETLGYALIHNAPWIFQGLWTLIQPLLDPVVADKVRFTSGRKGLEKYVATEQLIKEVGGDQAWSYEYVEPVLGENEKMDDTETRDRLLSERKQISDEFEAATHKWASNLDDAEVLKTRQGLANDLQKNYLAVDPHIRARSLYDRQGLIKAGGFAGQ